MSGLKHRQEFVGPKYQRVPSEDGNQSSVKISKPSWLTWGNGARFVLFGMLITAFGISLQLITHQPSTPVPLQNITELLSLAATPAIIAASGVLPTGRDSFIIKKPGQPNNQSIDVTMPANMSAYVGRRITVCAVGKQYATLTLLGGANYWTGDPYWTVVQFGLPNATGLQLELDQPRCCITFDVMTSSSVNVISKSSCTLYCTDINQWWCVDPSNPYQTNPLHGWWKYDAMLDYSFIGPTYMFIDATNPIAPMGRFLGGFINRPAEPDTISQVFGSVSYGPNYFQFMTIVGPNQLGYLLTDAGGFPIDPPKPSLLTHLQADQQTMYINTGRQTFDITSIADSLSGIGGSTDLTFSVKFSYKKVVPSAMPPILPATGVVPGIPNGNDDPVLSFDNWVNKALNMVGSVTHRKTPATTFSGFPAAYALHNQLKTSTVTHNTPIHSLKACHASNKIFLTGFGISTQCVTEIYTATYHHVVASASVTISGFTGAWAAANGVHEIHPFTDLKVTMDADYEDYSTNPDLATKKYRIVIYLDSSNETAFPRAADGLVNASAYGSPVLSVSYGPVTALSEYRETISTLNHWYVETFKAVVHAGLPVRMQDGATSLVDPVDKAYSFLTFLSQSANVLREVTSWQQFSDQLALNPFGMLYAFAGVSRNSELDYNPTGHFMARDNFHFGLGGIFQLMREDLLGPFGIRPTTDAQNKDGIAFPDVASDRTLKFYRTQTYGYNAAIENYLTGVKKAVWKTVGTTRSAPENLVAQLLYPGGEGDEFETILIDPNVVSFNDTLNPVPQYYSDLLGTFNAPLNDAPFFGQPPYPRELDDLIDPTMLVKFNSFGFIKSPILPANLTIGYMQFPIINMADSLNLMRWPQFCPTGVCNTSDPRTSFAAQTKAYSVIMSYLVQGGADHIIIDNRGNGGGEPACGALLREFFGTLPDMNHSQIVYSTANSNGQLPLKSLNNYTFDDGDYFKAVLALYGSSDPTKVATLYPEAIFKGGNVIFLTDTTAISGGDIFPNHFLGPNLNRQLGGNTEVKFVGSLEGRFAGAGDYFYQPANDEGRFIDSSLGFAVPAYDGIAEGGFLLVRRDNSPMYNRHPALQLFNTSGIPNRVTGLSGGNALPQNWERNIYPALGYTPNPFVKLTGWTGPQTPLILSIGRTPQLTVNLPADPFSMTGRLLTVTSLVAHGYLVGETVAINGGGALPDVPDLGTCTGDLLSRAHVIQSVPSATSFVLYIKFDGCDVGPTPIVGGGLGPIELKNRAQWRDHWLEQAIRVAIAAGPGANPGTKRALVHHEPRKVPKAKYVPMSVKESRAKYGRDVHCAPGLQLTNPADAPASTEMTIQVVDSSTPSATSPKRRGSVEKIRGETIKKMVHFLSAQLSSGGLCLDHTGKLKATPSFAGKPTVVHLDPQTLRPIEEVKRRRNAGKSLIKQHAKAKH